MCYKFILVINCGSSSLKFSLINAITQKIILSGISEKFNNNAYIKWFYNKQHKIINFNCNINHRFALKYLITKILTKYQNILINIKAVGHRIVHGGEKYTQPVIINSKIIEEIHNASVFAPLHNPIQLLGIKEIINLLPHLKNKQVAVFDTSFHQTMSPESYLYAIPLKFYTKYKIRKYGAHGTSHQFVSQQAANLLKIPLTNFNGITCHLGNGSSVTAIYKGKSIDTSMGLSPLEGLVMGTRCGNIDPSVIFYMYNQLHMSINDISNILMNQSGVLGLTNITSDFRYLEKNYLIDIKVKTAVNIFINSLAKYIASYSILMHNKIDALVFTGGIGENSILIREKTIKKLSILNFKLNKELNQKVQKKQINYINEQDSIPIMVIPTNEELVIAQHTAQILKI
ncbi:acetate kinase [Enterobacteriaceae endosymbiont of Neohaemonia nigricornis]|uniref:acetate kinase n=1 Tax=Enterobacteriaceae endosymbiont of Neohaemonia nigricornis TaxID=2675792 RepID=UPI001448FCC8|nr:acetate kinase [Enterobacteriaceae endosymbiont of Neohaemonia nigricornis]QJC30267.1 acetate/propionate family kinase [Enterobacteriaceae endosymbiont of Neohaemonia nigricornis]